MDQAITAHHVPLSLFAMIGVGPRVGGGAFANCNVGRKPQAADTSAFDHAQCEPEIKCVC